MTINKWGGLASFLIALSFMVAPPIYLIGNLRDAMGRLGYNLADFLSGPVLSVSLVTLIYVLRERIGQNAFRRMDLALLTAVLAAVGLAAVAFIRASNRHYHLTHPDLHLENATTVLLVWDTLVTGMNSLGFYFLGWTFVLLGSASWTSKLLPRPLALLYFLAGASSLFVYLLAELEGLVLLLGTVIGIWQGILLWLHDPRPNTTAG
ncbi:MAG: hypothetical protein OT477_04645 [Chloroflexi bacterium]|nr:hypothetical protein [Chloroflexota bacterium]